MNLSNISTRVAQFLPFLEMLEDVDSPWLTSGNMNIDLSKDASINWDDMFDSESHYCIESGSCWLIDGEEK